MSRLPDNREAASIDRAQLAELAGNDPAVERRLASVFRQTSAADVAALEEGFACRDLVAMAHAAHRIKGAAGLVGAKALVEICAVIERTGGAGEWSGIGAKRDALRREIERVYADLARLP